MKRDDEVRSDVIDLGAASESTKGAWGYFSDEVLMHSMPGLSDD